jgi:putative Mg2+ transporter-C (MgtC) family protein
MGGIVGWERQSGEGVAGLRTHMLVCLGSALVMIISAFGFSDILGKPAIVLDPSRMAAQVISGIGFLGAGSILVLRHQVLRGLTTAAGLWTVAAVGLAIGGGLYLAAGITTVIIVVILTIIKLLEKRLFTSAGLRSIHLLINSSQVKLSDLQAVVTSNGVEIAEISVHPETKDQTDHVRLKFQGKPTSSKMILILESLRNLPGVTEINYRV